jgi:hypothetical protein
VKAVAAVKFISRRRYTLRYRLVVQ